MKKIIVLVFIWTTSIHSLELNYRLLDKPQVQNFIDNQLDIVENKYFSFLVNVLEIQQMPEFINFFKSYSELGSSTTRYRNYCVYSLFERTNVNSHQTIDFSKCIEASRNLITLLRSMEVSFTQSLVTLQQLASGRVQSMLSSPSMLFLSYFITTKVSGLETQLNVLSQATNFKLTNLDQITLDIGNQLSVLHKGIRQAFIELVPSSMRRDLESFWLFYIDVLQERAEAKMRRDYWTINLLDLNIKVNEFFYCCERNKSILSKDTYNLCDDIHTEWNQILRMTLKF